MMSRGFRRSLKWMVCCLPLAGCDACDEDGGADGDFGPPTPIQGTAIGCVGFLTHKQGTTNERIAFPTGYDPANPDDAVARVSCGYSPEDMAAARNPDNAILLPPTNLENLEIKNTGYCACAEGDTSEWTQGCRDMCETLLDKHPVYSRANGYGCESQSILAPSSASKGVVCEHGSVVYFNGAPAQYVSGIYGNLHAEVHVHIDNPFPIPDIDVDDSDNATFAGTVQYSYTDISQGCGATGCGFVISRLKVIADDFQLDDVTAAGLHAVNQDLLVGTIGDDGHFTIPAGAGRIVVRYVEDGEEKRRAQPLQQPLTGVVDFATGNIVFNNFTVTSGAVFMRLEGFQSHVAASPPAPHFTPAGTIECNMFHAAAVAFDGTATTDPDGDIASFTWRLNNENVASGSIATIEVPLGPNTMRLDVTDSRFGVGMFTQIVDVVDTTPPAFGEVVTANHTSCDPNVERFTLVPPPVSDICTDVRIEAWLVSTVNTPPFPPRQLDIDAAELPAGEHTIQWIARDDFNNTSSVFQTLHISPALLGTHLVEAKERTQTRTAAGGFASIGSTGNGLTYVGTEARVGPLLSIGPVRLKNKAVVNGNLISGSSVENQGATVTGTVSPFSYVPIGTSDWLAPYAGATFGADLPVVGLGQTLVLDQPAYGRIEAQDGGTIVVATDVAVTELIVRPGATLRIADSDSHIVVRDRLLFSGSLLATQPGSLLTFAVLGNEAIINRPVSGISVLAPNAALQIGGGTDPSRVHLVVGRDLSIQPGPQLICDRGSRLPN